MVHDKGSGPRSSASRSRGLRRSIVAFARQSLAGLRALVVLTVALGALYPLAVVAVGQLAFPWQANGSLVTAQGERTTTRTEAVGSLLLAQASDGAEWFHPRPSAAGDGYDTLASGGSNLGPLNRELLATVQDRRRAVVEADGAAPGDVPADALTASGSGLDPHVSPAYALQQVSRVAAARGLPVASVRALVVDRTTGRDLGILGEPRVNVLELNLALGMMSS